MRKKLKVIPMDVVNGVPEDDESVFKDCMESAFNDCLNENVAEIDKNKKDQSTKWSKVNGECIIPVSETFDKLDAGYYTIGQSQTIGLYLSKMSIEMNKLYRLPNNATDLILSDISKFWTLEETYKNYHRVFRRNYLIYSAPGTGKTSLINLMCEDLIKKYNGIVILLNSDEEILCYSTILQRIRKIEPDRKIITIIEDFDNYVSPNDCRNTPTDGALLNILDGNCKVGGIVTIATTNYIEKIANRYKNRPSRFDRVIEFPLPNAVSRRMFIEKTVLPDDLKKIDIDRWVKRTDGFTIDHINELILLYFVFGHSEEESFSTIENMIDNNDNLTNKTSVNKTTLGFFDDGEDEPLSDIDYNPGPITSTFSVQ